MTEFIEILYAQGIISISQFEDLIRLTQEGMNAFDDMYLIPYYLEAKHKGQTWIKQQTDTKEVMKRMTQGITQSLVSHNYQIANP